MKRKLSAKLGACCITDKNGDPCTANYLLLIIGLALGIGSKIAEKKYGQVR